MLARHLLPLSLTAALLAGAVGAAAPAAEAQRARPSAEARKKAREAYAEGQRLFRQGRFQDAEVAFLRAYEHVPNAVVWVSVAEARARRGNVAGAIEAYERYLRERPDAPDKATIEKKLEELRATPARLQVVSEPPGASILVDGEETGKQAPAELEVPGGTHELRLRLEGMEEASQQVSVAPGERREVRIALRPAATPEPEAAEAPGAVEDDEADDALEDDGEGDLLAPPTTAAGGPSTAVWVSAGVAAAGLVSGTVLGFLALSEESAFQENPTTETADRGERYALFADVAFGVGAVAAVTALVLHFADMPPEEGEEDDLAAVRLTPLAGPTGAGVAARVDF